MSTKLQSLKGKIELSNGKSDYFDTEVSLTSFYGGIQRGQSLQLAFLNEKEHFSHIQLDNENVNKLVAEISSHFNLSVIGEEEKQVIVNHSLFIELLDLAIYAKKRLKIEDNEWNHSPELYEEMKKNILSKF